MSKALSPSYKPTLPIMLSSPHDAAIATGTAYKNWDEAGHLHSKAPYTGVRRCPCYVFS